MSLADPSTLRLHDPFQLRCDCGLVDAALCHAHRELVQSLGRVVLMLMPLTSRKTKAESTPARLLPSTNAWLPTM